LKCVRIKWQQRFLFQINGGAAMKNLQKGLIFRMKNGCE